MPSVQKLQQVISSQNKLGDFSISIKTFELAIFAIFYACVFIYLGRPWVPGEARCWLSASHTMGKGPGGTLFVHTFTCDTWYSHLGFTSFTQDNLLALTHSTWVEHKYPSAGSVGRYDCASGSQRLCFPFVHLVTSNVNMPWFFLTSTLGGDTQALTVGRSATMVKVLVKGQGHQICAKSTVKKFPTHNRKVVKYRR